LPQRFQSTAVGELLIEYDHIGLPCECPLDELRDGPAIAQQLIERVVSKHCTKEILQDGVIAGDENAAEPSLAIRAIHFSLLRGHV
jgi:hypothetical protein